MALPATAQLFVGEDFPENDLDPMKARSMAMDEEAIAELRERVAAAAASPTP